MLTDICDTDSRGAQTNQELCLLDNGDQPDGTNYQFEKSTTLYLIGSILSLSIGAVAWAMPMALINVPSGNYSIKCQYRL